MASGAGEHVGHLSRRWERWTLRGILTALLVVTAVVTLAVNALAIFNAVQTRHNVERQQQVDAPLNFNVDALQAALLNQETGERGYLITGQQAALSPYADGRAAADRLFTEIAGELRGDSLGTARLATLRTLDQTWVATVATVEIGDVAAGRTPAAVALEQSGTGRDQFNGIRAATAALSAEVNQRREDLAHTILQSTESTIVVSVVRSLLLLLVVVALWLMLTRLVAEPIERLDADVQAVAGGSLDQAITAHGLRELATLGRNTEAMRRALRDDSDQLRQLRQALAQRSPLHSLISSELESTEELVDASIAGRLLPADGVLAGDWYDAWDVGDQQVALALVDVSGHGPEAGIMALRIKHLLRAPFRMGMEPGTALRWVADQLNDLGEQCVTVILLRLDYAAGRLRYANAGHPMGLVVRSDRIDALGKTGPLICDLEGLAWETGEVPLDHGDLVVLVTDGVIEARLPDGSEFGLDRVRSIVLDLGPEATPDDVAEELILGVRAACETPLRDDATVVVTRFEPQAGATTAARTAARAAAVPPAGAAGT